MNKKIIILLIAICFSITNVFSFIKNSDDIPPTGIEQNCKTSAIHSCSNSVLTMEEEEYINDIPFDTEAIAKKALNKEQFIEMVLEEEEYINDIPFNTAKIVKQYCLLKSPKSKKTKKHCCKKYCKSDTADCIIH